MICTSWSGAAQLSANALNRLPNAWVERTHCLNSFQPPCATCGCGTKKTTPRDKKKRKRDKKNDIWDKIKIGKTGQNKHGQNGQSCQQMRGRRRGERGKGWGPNLEGCPERERVNQPRVGAHRKVGAPKGGVPKMSRFFPSPATIFILSLSLWVFPRSCPHLAKPHLAKNPNLARSFSLSLLLLVGLLVLVVLAVCWCSWCLLFAGVFGACVCVLCVVGVFKIFGILPRMFDFGFFNLGQLAN